MHIFHVWMFILCCCSNQSALHITQPPACWITYRQQGAILSHFGATKDSAPPCSESGPKYQLGTCQKIFPSPAVEYSSWNKMIFKLFETRYCLTGHNMPCLKDISLSSQSHDFPFSCKPLKSYDVENKVCNHGTVYPCGETLYNTLYNFRSPDLSDPQGNFTVLSLGCFILVAEGTNLAVYHRQVRFTAF